MPSERPSAKSSREVGPRPRGSRRPSPGRRRSARRWATVDVLLFVLAALSLAGLPTGMARTPVNGSGPPPYRTLRTFEWTYYFNESCDRTIAPSTPSWHNRTGNLREGLYAKARLCQRYGPVYAEGSLGEVRAEVGFLVPITVGTNGSHGIRENWTLNLSSAANFTSSGCPAKALIFVPPASTSAWCQAYTIREVTLTAQLLDLAALGSPLSTAELDVYSSIGWANETVCQVGPTGLPGCSTSVGPIVDANYTHRERAVLGTPWSWNGSTSFSTFTGASGLRTSAEYGVEVTLELYAVAAVDQSGLASDWHAQSSVDLRLARTGTYLRLDSFTVN